MDTAPISLYFGVEQGKRANLETIAHASLEWASLIRDIAAVVAPEVEFEIEFVQSKEGSVWLSNLLKAVKEGDRKALGSIVAAVLVFFAMGPALHLQTDFGTWLLEQLGHEDKVDISDASAQEIVDRVLQAVDETDLEERRRNIIRHAESDPDVTSIGVDFQPRTEGPATKITRDQFASYDSLPPPAPLKPTEEEDVTHERNIDVTIVRATLREGDKRPRWRFRHGDEEWSATIEDEGFIWALHEDKTGLSLGVGQHMRIDVAIDLKRVNDDWEPDDRRVIRVRSPHVPRRQGELGLGGE